MPRRGAQGGRNPRALSCKVALRISLALDSQSFLTGTAILYGNDCENLHSEQQRRKRIA